MERKTTRNDVAKLAGVSPALVSYVINKTKPVSEEKTAAVLRAIEELHYRPNLYARGLKTNRSMQIAYVCDNLRNDWLEISESMFMDQGYSVSHRYSSEKENFIQSLIDGQFDGVFMLSNRYRASQLNAIASNGIPIVLYRTRDYSFLEPNIVTVAPNIYDAVRKIISYLIVRGHRRILFVPPIRYNLNLKKGYRERAYKEVLEENGLPWDETLICRNTASLETLRSEVFDRVFSGKPSARPTALMAGDDYLAGHMIQYLKKLGVRVPQDVAVVGMDNMYLAEMLSPQLTTVDFSKQIFSEKLVETMLSLIRGERPQDELIDVSLVVREST